MKIQLSRIGCTALLITAAFTGIQPVRAACTNGLLHTITVQGVLTKDDWGTNPGPGDGPPLPFPIVDVVPIVIHNCAPLPCPDYALDTNTVTLGPGGFFTMPIVIPEELLADASAVALKFAVRTNGGGEFTMLSGTLPLTAVPYASVAQSVLGPIPASNLTGSMPTGMLTGTFTSPLNFSNPGNVFAGDGSGLTHVDAATISGLDPCNLHCYWKLSGNGDATESSFSGTTTEKTLTLKANNEIVMRYVPRFGGAPGAALIGGSELNTIWEGGGGSVICGGGGIEINAPYRHLPNGIENDGSAIVGGLGNLIQGRESFIGGGLENTIADGNHKSTHYVVIGGGINNYATNVDSAFIGGGANNLVAGYGSVVAGGIGNQAAGSQSSVGGGTFNTASGTNSTVPGGSNNLASGSASLAAGNRAKALHDGAFVWSDSQNADFTSTANDQFAVRAQNGIMIQGTTTTLDLRGDGAIRVAGAGVASRGPVFIHRATAVNTSGHITTIDHPLANGDPNAILLVTHNFSADTAATPYEPNSVGVWYDGSHWTIYHENTSAAMPVGRAFNVMIIKP